MHVTDKDRGALKRNLLKELVRCPLFSPKGRQRSTLTFTSAILILANLVGCGPRARDLEAVDYTPLPGEDWPVSTPAEQGLDPTLVARLYYDATEVETLQALLVIKNGYLIAEGYLHGGSVEQKTNVQSVTKSYTSASVGIALEQGCLSSVDQRMIEFFPELADRITDERKKQITLRQMLQMRAGYPWEESTAELFEVLYTGFRPSTLVDIPLAYDPGTKFDYSNLTSHLLGIVVARACGTDLRSYAQEHLLSPLDTEVGFWQKDWEGYYLGYAEMHLAARDMAKFGLMYLNDGTYQGNQIVPAEWVRESLQTYSENAWRYRVGRNFRDIGYGYQWWSVRAGKHRYNLAWGHGGQQIALLDDLDMVVVVKADPLYRQHGDRPWKLEKANLNLVADFIASLPSQ
jgi:CubicO group peptidase (beta-lactamase class C family)